MKKWGLLNRNVYLKTMPHIGRYGGKVCSLKDYMQCFCCGSTAPMRGYEHGDLIDGALVTLQATVLGAVVHS